jgi:hypothetical protein
MIQKDESSSIKIISAPGGRQSHSFATMDDLSSIVASTYPVDKKRFALFPANPKS